MQLLREVLEAARRNSEMTTKVRLMGKGLEFDGSRRLLRAANTNRRGVFGPVCFKF